MNELDKIKALHKEMNASLGDLKELQGALRFMAKELIGRVHDIEKFVGEINCKNEGLRDVVESLFSEEILHKKYQPPQSASQCTNGVFHE